MQKRDRIRQYANDLGRLGGEAINDGLTPYDLVTALAASIHAVVRVVNGKDSDVAEVFWQLSRHYDVTHEAQEHTTPLTCSTREFNAAFGQQ